MPSQPGISTAGGFTAPPTYYRRTNYSDDNFGELEKIYDVKEIDDSASGTGHKHSVRVANLPTENDADSYLMEYLGIILSPHPAAR
jgi:hypothetical protein